MPIPALEPFVRARTSHYDPAYLSADPGFTHAHVTALGPFRPRLDEATSAAIAGIATSVPGFVFRLEQMATFPNGIIHLRPEPDEPFRELRRRLERAFPDCLPYAGEFLDPVPHLTLDLCSPEVTEDSTRALLGDLVPCEARAERLDLALYAPSRCRVLASWPLGGATSARPR